VVAFSTAARCSHVLQAASVDEEMQERNREGDAVNPAAKENRSHLLTK